MEAFVQVTYRSGGARQNYRYGGSDADATATVVATLPTIPNDFEDMRYQFHYLSLPEREALAGICVGQEAPFDPPERSHGDYRKGQPFEASDVWSLSRDLFRLELDDDSVVARNLKAFRANVLARVRHSAAQERLKRCADRKFHVRVRYEYANGNVASSLIQMSPDGALALGRALILASEGALLEELVVR